MTNDKTVEEIAKDAVEKLSDDVTRSGKYKRDGKCLFEENWIDLERYIAEALTAERRRAEELEATIIQALEEERCVMPRDTTTRTEQILMMAKMNPGKCSDCGCNTWNSRSGFCQKCKRLRVENGTLFRDPNDQLKFEALESRLQEAEAKLIAMTHVKDTEKRIRQGLEKEVERLKDDNDGQMRILENKFPGIIPYGMAMNKIKELEARIEEQDRLIEWYKQDTADLIKMKKELSYFPWTPTEDGVCTLTYAENAVKQYRELQASLSKHKKLVEAVKKHVCSDMLGSGQDLEESLASLDKDKLDGEV